MWMDSPLVTWPADQCLPPRETFESRQCNRNRLWKQGSLLLPCCLRVDMPVRSAKVLWLCVPSSHARPGTSEATQDSSSFYQDMSKGLAACRSLSHGQQHTHWHQLHQHLHPDFPSRLSKQYGWHNSVPAGRMQPGWARRRPVRCFHLVPPSCTHTISTAWFRVPPLCHRLNLRLQDPGASVQGSLNPVILPLLNG